MSQLALERNKRKALLKAAQQAQQAKLEILEQKSLDEVLSEGSYSGFSDTSNVFVRSVPTLKLIAPPHELNSFSAGINKTQPEQKVSVDLTSRIDKAKHICKSGFLTPCENHAKYSARILCKDQLSGSPEYTSCIIDSYELSKSICLDLCGKIFESLSDL